MKEVVIYSDGSCLGNPGPGGWASILKYGDHEKMISGGDKSTTNNRMELLGVINALQALKEPCKVYIVTDSQYVVNAFNKGWIFNWVKSEFRGRPNSDLWSIMWDLHKRHELTFDWVKGHNGHPENERCDAEAQKQAEIFKKMV